MEKVKFGEFEMRSVENPWERLLLATIVKAFNDLASTNPEIALDAYLFLKDDGGFIGDWFQLPKQYQLHKLLFDKLREKKHELH
jgi:hypothetical protein